MQVYLWVLFTLITSLAWTFEEGVGEDYFNSSLIKTQSLLPTTINSISALSGEWLDSETDFIVAGPEPVVLTRSYSLNNREGWLGFNWDFDRLDFPLVIQRGIEYQAIFRHPSGIKTSHKGKKKGNSIYLPLGHTQGLTNCCSGEISARSNLHNTSLQVDMEEKNCLATTGSGLITYFKFFDKDPRGNLYFIPDFERRPSGIFFSIRVKQPLKLPFLRPARPMKKLDLAGSL